MTTQTTKSWREDKPECILQFKCRECGCTWVSESYYQFSHLPCPECGELSVHEDLIDRLPVPPSSPCHICQGTIYWWRKCGSGGDWLCWRCHPGSDHAATIKIGGKENVNQ